MSQSAVKRIEVLFLDDKGYGPTGEHTRRSWRQACLDNLLAGAEVFDHWQQPWLTSAQAARIMPFDYTLHFVDGSYQTVKVFAQGGALDFVGQVLDEVDFRALSCGSTALFDAVTFKTPAWFEGASFLQDAQFSHALFEIGASFDNVTFAQAVSFEAATFWSKARFSGAKFLGRAGFQQAVFDDWVHIESARFAAEAKFDGAQFAQDVTFDRSVFAAVSSFKQVLFNSDANFSHVRFETDTSFEQVHVTHKLDFSHATFAGVSTFKAVGFGDAVWFKAATFRRDALFQGEHFDCEARFDEAVFEGVARFESAQFMQDTSFKAAKFEENANFAETVFAAATWFEQAAFMHAAWFDSTVFEGNLWFDQAVFAENAWFKGAIFCKHTGFESVTFAERANFENACFKHVGHFEKAIFSQQYPSFRGCNEETTRLELSYEQQFTKRYASDESVANAAFLKQLSDVHGQVDQALMFNAMALRTKRLLRLAAVEKFKYSQRFLTSEWWAAHITWLYAVFSDFGRSVMRPITAYLAMLLLTFCLCLVYASVHPPRLCQTETTQSWLSHLSRTGACQQATDTVGFNGYRAAFEYSVNAGIGLFASGVMDQKTVAINQRLFSRATEPFAMRLWGLLMSLVSVLSLFLLVLGLRNRYRLR